MKITFDYNVCKITKGAMVMAYNKNEGTLYMVLDFGTIISVASSKLDAGGGIRDLGICARRE